MCFLACLVVDSYFYGIQNLLLHVLPFCLTSFSESFFFFPLTIYVVCLSARLVAEAITNSFLFYFLFFVFYVARLLTFFT